MLRLASTLFMAMLFQVSSYINKQLLSLIYWFIYQHHANHKGHMHLVPGWLGNTNWEWKRLILAFAIKDYGNHKCLTHKFRHLMDTPHIQSRCTIISRSSGEELDHEICALLGYYTAQSGNSLLLGTCFAVILI